MASIRPERTVLAFRWVELQQDMTWLEALRLLRKGRYQKWGRWFISISLLLLLLAWVAVRESIALVGTAAAIASAAMFGYRWLFANIELNSLVIFYEDKATILQNVELPRATLTPIYEVRRDVTAGGISRKLTINDINPFWRIGNLSVVVRGTWLTLSMQSGWLNRPRRFQRTMLQDKAITFAEMKRRLLAYRKPS